MSTTDKFLLNYKVIPLIRLALPNVRIIHLRRNAKDTFFGCYRQLFNAGLGFTYKLEDLADTFLSYRQTLSLWQALMPSELLIIDFEALVDDLPTCVRQLLDSCGLPWEDSCLRFDTSDRAVKTASSLQVRQPVFSHGIGRWKTYATQLAPLQSRLGDAFQDL